MQWWVESGNKTDIAWLPIPAVEVLAGYVSYIYCKDYLLT